LSITILGGGGFLGAKLARRLARDGRLGGRPVEALTLFDLQPPPPVDAPFPVRCLGGDVSDPAALAAAIPPETRVVVHLAAVVSAQAEADFDLGLKVNLHGHAVGARGLPSPPSPARVVFTSSVASFGGGQGALLPDDARQVPGNSYGAQKAMGELLLADASRRGMVDAVSIRLPTVTVRPGRPNKAASSFVSAILREPLLGLPAELPVDEDFAVWICSPRRAVEWLLHAMAMDTAAMGADRGVNPPGMSAAVGDMLAALERVAGPDARALVRPAPTRRSRPSSAAGPPPSRPERARTRLGFSEQEPLDELVRAFVEDDLEETRRDRGL
jgi:nucleoside-diphosphate-sugar epimerase